MNINEMETMDTPVVTSLPQTDENEMQTEHIIDGITEVEDLITLPRIDRSKETKLIDKLSENSSNPNDLYVDMQKEEAVAFDGSETDNALEDNSHEDSGEFVVTVLARGNLEDQDVGKRISPPILETPLEASTHWDEDVTAETWRQHRKHVFVLSEAGKPIYSRYGSEEALSSTMGVMMALVSFIQSGDNVIRSVYSGIDLLHGVKLVNATIINESNIYKE